MIKVGFIGAGDIAYLHGEGVQQAEEPNLLEFGTALFPRQKKKPDCLIVRFFHHPKN